MMLVAFLTSITCRLVIGTLAFVAVARPAIASLTTTEKTSDPLEDDALCGIHALYNAAALLGVRVEYAELLRPEYIGSQEGSSMAELGRAASAIGLRSMAVEGMTVNDLRWSRWPIVLHVTPH